MRYYIDTRAQAAADPVSGARAAGATAEPFPAPHTTTLFHRIFPNIIRYFSKHYPILYTAEPFPAPH